MEYPNSGALFHQSVKKNPKAPDYSGDIDIDLAALGLGNGKHKLRLAGWKKQSKNGNTFLSLKVSVPQERTNGGYAPRTAPAGNDGFGDEDIPF
jgi:uncharacterized protein (DUF736 family)